MSQSQQIKEITARLEKGIVDLFQSDNYKSYLKTMSKFTSYSVNNTLLIAMQRPDATAVAGYSTWKQLNRQVVKGAKAIKIIAPCPYKKKADTATMATGHKHSTGEDNSPADLPEEKVLMGFKVVNVFDISQTEGEPLPEIAHKLDGTVDGYTDFMDALQGISPVPIKFEQIKGSANGYYHLVDKNIVIDKDLPEIMHCKTGIHELAHALLHDRDNGLQKDNLPDKETKEIQAESIAYTVCSYYGIDTSDYSFGYISGWSSGRDLKELKSSFDTIQQTAQTIIVGLDRELDGIRQARQIGTNISGPEVLHMTEPTKSSPHRHYRH